MDPPQNIFFRLLEQALGLLLSTPTPSATPQQLPPKRAQPHLPTVLAFFRTPTFLPDYELIFITAQVPLSLSLTEINPHGYTGYTLYICILSKSQKPTDI